MKKLLSIAAFLLAVTVSSFAGNYKLDNASVDALFAQSEDVTLTISEDMMNTSAASVLAEGEQTKLGFLLRAYFCGQFALHRSYMGTKGLFVKYFCTFGFVACIDFWWVVFKGDPAFERFKGNNEFVVWSKKNGGFGGK